LMSEIRRRTWPAASVNMIVMVPPDSTRRT
jgi:hypothetical protein